MELSPHQKLRRKLGNIHELKEQFAVVYSKSKDAINTYIANAADLVTGTFRLLDEELLAYVVVRELGATLVIVQQDIDGQVRSRYSCVPDPELYWELRVGVVDAEGITKAWAGLSTRYRDLP